MFSRAKVCLQHGACSNTGLVRSNNEDAWLEDTQLGLFIVADGMGGYQAGEVASRMTVQTMRDRVAAGDSLIAAAAAAQAVLEQAADQGQGTASMGTTMVAVQISGGHYQLAWVGDSRAYLWHHGELQQLSKDHSYVQSLVDRHIITAHQAEQHPQRNLLSRCLSGGQFDSPEVDVRSGAINHNDLILLCSDGLSNELADIEIAELLHEHAEVSMPGLAKSLVDAALARGGRDNVTVLVVKSVA